MINPRLLLSGVWQHSDYRQIHKTDTNEGGECATTANDLKKAQIILSMYLLITKNPHLTPKDLMDISNSLKYKHHR